MRTDRYALENGLTVLMREQHAAPVVAMAMWVGVGSADEQEAEAGLAHVHEHMLFKGTQRRGVGQIAREIEASGGAINAFTSFDHTVYYVTISSRYFEEGLDILCDAICNSAFDPEELERELEVILEEIKRGEDQPSRQTMEAVFGLAYTTHPYAKPVIGTRASVAAFTHEDVLRFYRRWYVAKNMTLVVVGDVDPEAARASIESKLSDLAPGGDLTHARPAEPEQHEMRVSLHAGQTPEVHTAMAFHVPGIDHEDTPALDVIRLLLSYGDSSRLGTRLERELQWVNDVHAGAYTPKDPGLFMLTADHQRTPDHPGVPGIVEAILDTLTDLGQRPISEEELLRAKTLLQSSQIYQRQTVEGQAMVLGSYETVANNHRYEEIYYKRLQQIGTTDLVSVVQRYFTPENLSIAVYAEEEAIAEIDEDEVRAAALKGLSGKSTLFARPEVLERDKDGITRVEIEGGPTILIQEDDAVELVSVRVAFMGGQRHEPAQSIGVSHLLSALWTRGTESRTLTEIAREVESMGSGLDAYGGRNSMGIQMEMLSAHFTRAMSLIADCLAHPTFDAQLLDIERRLVLESIQARADNLGVIGGGLLRQAIFEGHPYARDILGSAESISEISRDDIIALYRQCVSPDKMVISVVGNVVAEEVVALLAERFAPGTTFLEGPEQPPLATVAPAKPVDGPLYVHTTLDKKQALVILGFRSVDVASPDRHKLDLISAILSGQGGRLFLELRDRQSLAYSVYASSLLGVDPGAFSLNIATSPEKIEQAARGLFREIERLKTELVTDEELDRAKLYLIGNHDIQLQSFSTRAMQLALDELYSLGYRDHREFPNHLMGITAQDLLDTAQRLFTPERSVLAIVRPPDVEVPDLSDIGYTLDS